MVRDAGEVEFDLSLFCSQEPVLSLEVIPGLWSHGVGEPEVTETGEPFGSKFASSCCWEVKIVSNVVSSPPQAHVLEFFEVAG